MEREGIDGGREYTQRHDQAKDPDGQQEGVEQAEQSACHKAFGGKTVGTVPVLPTVQRPWHLDAHCVVLVGF